MDQARVFFSRAKTVIPKHSQLTTMKSMIDSHVVKPPIASVAVPRLPMPAMRTQNLLLPTKLIKQQGKELARWLAVVANTAQKLQATILIVAPTDAHARWVYQTMNSADPDQRIRANIKRSMPARLEVSYLAQKDEREVYPN